MTRVPPSNVGRPPSRPQKSQAPQAPSRPRSSKSSQMSAAQRAQEAKADEQVPELKDGSQQAGEGGGGPDWKHPTAEYAAVGGGQQEHLDREDRLDSQEARSEEERKEEQKKLAGSKGVVAQKGQQQKSQRQQGQPLQRLKSGMQETGFEPASVRLHDLKKAQELQKLQSPPPPPRAGGSLGDALKALHSAQEQGVFFKEEGYGGASRPDEAPIDPELEAAVEECIRLLFGVQGILRIGPGVNEVNEPVVVIVATRGFSAKSLQAVPPSVHRFKTLLALPFTQLPLRRERP